MTKRGWKLRVEPLCGGAWQLSVIRPDGHLWGEPVEYNELRKAKAAAEGMTERPMQLELVKG